jgi:peptidoglycan hydrolase CwlO-like protein
MDAHSEQSDRFDVPDDFGAGKSKAGALGIAALVLVLITLVVGALLVNWLAGRLNDAETRSVKLQEALDKSLASSGKMGQAFADYVKQNDSMTSKFNEAIQAHDQGISSMSEVANKIADRLNLVDDDVTGVQKKVKGQSAQIGGLKRKFGKLDDKFGEIAVAIREESAKNKIELSDILGKIDDARTDLMLLKADVQIVKDSVEFVPTE